MQYILSMCSHFSSEKTSSDHLRERILTLRIWVVVLREIRLRFSLAEVAVLIKFCITFLFVNNEKLSFGQ